MNFTGDNALKNISAKDDVQYFVLVAFTSPVRKANRGRWRQIKDVELSKRYTTKEVFEHPSFNLSWSPEELRYISKLCILVPQDLKVHLTARINICYILIKHEKKLYFFSFFKWLINGGVNWVVYYTVVRKRSGTDVMFASKDIKISHS